MNKPLHYWRIHKRVMLRVWADLSDKLRYIIATDADHETEESKWFANKVHADTMRLFEDPLYYDNAEFTFKVGRAEPVTS